MIRCVGACARVHSRDTIMQCSFSEECSYVSSSLENDLCSNNPLDLPPGKWLCIAFASQAAGCSAAATTRATVQASSVSFPREAAVCPSITRKPVVRPCRRARSSLRLDVQPKISSMEQSSMATPTSTRVHAGGCCNDACQSTRMVVAGKLSRSTAAS